MNFQSRIFFREDMILLAAGKEMTLDESHHYHKRITLTDPHTQEVEATIPKLNSDA